MISKARFLLMLQQKGIFYTEEIYNQVAVWNKNYNGESVKITYFFDNDGILLDME